MTSQAELRALLHLQELDTTIRVLDRRLQELPEQAALDAHLDRAAAVKAGHDARRVDLDRLDAEIRKAEGDVGLLEQRRDADRARLYGGEVSNPRELQALRADLDHVAGRIGEHEDALLELMERREELAGDVDLLAAQRDELDAEQQRLEAARDDAAKEVLAELAEARVSRDAVAGQISDELLARYERAKERFGGVGVGALEHGMCTACRLELTPLEIADARDSGALSTCPQCQRLLAVVD